MNRSSRSYATDFPSERDYFLIKAANLGFFLGTSDTYSLTTPSELLVPEPIEASEGELRLIVHHDDLLAVVGKEQNSRNQDASRYWARR